MGISKFLCCRHKKILHYCCPPQEDSLLLLSPQAAGHRPAPPGTEGRPDSTERKNTKRGTISYYRVYWRVEGAGQKIKTQKEVRFDTTEHTVGRRGEGWGRRGKTQREVRFDIAEYTTGRRGVPGEEKHKKRYDLILQSILEGGWGWSEKKNTTPLYCCRHRPPGTAHCRRAPGGHRARQRRFRLYETHSSRNVSQTVRGDIQLSCLENVRFTEAKTLFS